MPENNIYIDNEEAVVDIIRDDGPRGCFRIPQKRILGNTQDPGVWGVFIPVEHRSDLTPFLVHSPYLSAYASDETWHASSTTKEKSFMLMELAHYHMNLPETLCQDGYHGQFLFQPLRADAADPWVDMQSWEVECIHYTPNPWVETFRHKETPDILSMKNRLTSSIRSNLQKQQQEHTE